MATSWPRPGQTEMESYFSLRRSAAWEDLDGNGIQDGGEPGAVGVTVTLRSTAAPHFEGVEISSTLTDAEGIYGSLAIASGNYRIGVELPAEAAFSVQDAGVDDLIDSDVDPTSGQSELFAYAAATGSRNHDAGLLFPP